jgi:membrane associated rhomboid family serine protease
MQDGDTDYSGYSPQQLIVALRDMSAQRFPRNYASARQVLQAKWPAAPDDLATVKLRDVPDERQPPRRLANGATLFAVRFNPRTELEPGEPWPNNLGLGGAGTVIVDEQGLVLAETPLRPPAADADPAPAGHPLLQFKRAEIESVWQRESDQVVIADAGGRREVVLFLQSPADAQALLALLPSGVAPALLANQERIARFRAFMQGLGPGIPVTRTLIGINVAVFALMLLTGAGLVVPNPVIHVAFGSNYGPLTFGGEPWRLLTSAFIHFGIVHLVFNMYALHNGGELIEKLFGRARFATVYLLAALGGSVASSWWDPLRNSAGASGAVFGVYGALLAFFLMRRQEIPAATLRFVGRGAATLLGYSLFFGAVSPFVDNSAHVGGLLAGAASGALLARPLDLGARAVPRPRQVALVIAAVGLVLLLMASAVELA